MISWSTPPLVWNNRYLVIGCQTGQLCFWDLVQNESINNNFITPFIRKTKIAKTNNNINNKNDTTKLVDEGKDENNTTTTTTGTTIGRAPMERSPSNININKQQQQQQSQSQHQQQHEQPYGTFLPDAILDLPIHTRKVVVVPNPTKTTITPISISSEQQKQGREVFPIVQIISAPRTFVLPTTKEDETRFSSSKDSIGSDLSNYIVAINAVGMVYIISLKHDDEEKLETSGNSSSLRPDHTTTTTTTTTTKIVVQPQIVTSWYTNRYQLSSVLPLANSSTVILGYQNNCIEGWQIVTKGQKVTKYNNNNGSNDKKSTNTTSILYTARLLWRASYSDIPSGIISVINMTEFSYDCSKRPTEDKCTDEKKTQESESSSSIVLTTEDGGDITYQRDPSNATTIQQDTSVNDSTNDPKKTTSKKQFIFMTLYRDSKNNNNNNNNNSMVPTTATIEVINISSIQIAWNELMESSTSSSNNPSTETEYCIPIEDHWVLPEIGMEIIDSTLLPKSPSVSKLYNHYIPSLGTNSICRLNDNHDDNSNKTTTKISVALADGTVLLLQATSDNNGYLSWGVQPNNDARQLLLSYPAIGTGVVHYTDNATTSSLTKDVISSTQQQYIACCLRGGTTYLIPTSTDRNTGSSPNVIVFQYPQDIDSDSFIRYVQGFTAGDIHIPDDDDSNHTKTKNNPRTIPLFIYSWPSGVIEIFYCGLVSKQYPNNGTVRNDTDIDVPRSSDGCTSTTGSTDRIDIESLQDLIQNGSVFALQTTLESIDESLLPNLEPLWISAHHEIQSQNYYRTIKLDELRSNELLSFRTLLIQLSSKQDPVVQEPAISDTVTTTA